VRARRAKTSSLYGRWHAKICLARRLVLARGARSIVNACLREAAPGSAERLRRRRETTQSIGDAGNAPFNGKGRDLPVQRRPLSFNRGNSYPISEAKGREVNLPLPLKGALSFSESDPPASFSLVVTRKGREENWPYSNLSAPAGKTLRWSGSGSKRALSRALSNASPSPFHCAIESSTLLLPLKLVQM